MSLIKIHNRYLNDITWAEAAACDFVTRNTVDTWRINISANLSRLNRFSEIINLNELARADRYFHKKDSNRFIVSRGALRIILGKYLNQLPAAIEFEISANKKPYIKNTGTHNLLYNVSHSGDWILIAVSDSEIGVDTEFVDPSFDYKELIQENFSRPEIDYINQNSFESFFLLWTRKEALTKATGKGLDDDLKLIPCLDGIYETESAVISSTENWLVNSFKLDEDYLASVACSVKIEANRFWDIDFFPGKADL